MKFVLVIALSAPMFCLPALAETGPTYSAMLPAGAGDPDAITCFQPKTKVGWHLPPQPLCRTNATWARFHKYQMFAPASSPSAEYSNNGTPQLATH